MGLPCQTPPLLHSYKFNPNFPILNDSLTMSTRKKLDLEMQINELQAVLEREQRLNRFLRFAMHEPLVVSHSCLSSVIPIQLQVLLAELAIVEEEIICLERRVEDLKLCLIQERKQQKNYFCCLGRTSQDLVTIPSQQLEEKPIGTPNNISEELTKSLISIFHKLHRPGNRLDCEITSVPKLTISCINSRSFISCKSNPMQVLDIDGMTRNIGFYKNCIQLTRNSFDPNRIYLCVADIARVQILIDKLQDIELNCLTYKQKLAFWINIYNASIMHAFLQHGLPQTSEKLLTLLNKAAVNVGGIVLNALAIEHFILRNSSMNGKDAKLWRKYGLGYPEPNVTFALCRGNWSSPALRVYTAEDVVNGLERAKVEYLEASICITNKKKIFMPKLLHWHMKDFADDIVSLLEWIYSQLPRSSSLKCSVMECLNGNTKASLIKSVEIQPYDAEFRYLLPC